MKKKYLVGRIFLSPSLRAKLAHYIYWIATPSSSIRARNDGLEREYFSTFFISLIFLFHLAFTFPPNQALAVEAPKPPEQSWSFEGPFGTWDRAQLQRGYQVYKEVCSSCHAMNLISFRNLAALGFSEAEIKAIAHQYTVIDGPNDLGEMVERPGIPSDTFVAPYPNPEAARAANNGALPPDLSLVINARKYGADYVYALLNGYQDPPSGVKVGEGMYYNVFFSGHQIAMAPPLSEGQIQYSDGTPTSVEQMSRDVTAFLHWAANPKMEQRKEMGAMVIIYMLIFTVLMYLVMQRIWARVEK